MQKLSLGLIGCGGISGQHVEGYRDLATRGLGIFDIKAVCDSVEQNAGSKAEAIGYFQGFKPKTYADFESMLKNESLDVVDICLPHNVHHVVSSRCLESGLHVIIEKPLGITMRAARVIIEKAKKTTKVLAVAENYRRSAQERALWWALRQGIIGEPRMILRILASWRPKPWAWREDKLVAGGSWVYDGGVHWADTDRYHLSREAIEVFAVAHTFDKVKDGVNVTVDDMLFATIRYEREAYSQWVWTVAAPGKMFYNRTIHGSNGALSNDGAQIAREPDVIETQSMNALVNSMKKNMKAEDLDRFFPKGTNNTFAIELYDFYDSIVNRRRPEVDSQEAYKDMAIPLGFYESAILNKPVKIRDVEDLRVEEYQKEINERLDL